VFGLAAIGQYFRTKKQASYVSDKSDTFYDRQTVDRLVVAVERIAHAVEELADKRQTEMQKTLEHIASKIQPKG
jgi:hypothetical protein